MAACLTGLAATSVPATAVADSGGTTPFIQHWSAFSGGHVGGYTVGDPIVLSYVDPSGQTTERRFCWNPAPIDRPACEASTVAAPAQTGTQTVTAKLSDGRSVTTRFAVGPANTVLGNGTGAFAPPVLYTVNGSIALYGDTRLTRAIGQVAVGQRLGGYYSPSKGVTQVYDYATNQSGYVPSALLNAPASPIKTYAKVVHLRSNQTVVYTLALPPGFRPAVEDATGAAIDYSLYRTDAIGTGTGRTISRTGRGDHAAYLGATVVRSTYTSAAVTVKVTTGDLTVPITLRVAANGTVS